MDNNIIDLTISPTAQYIVLDDGDEQPVQTETQKETQVGQDREKRRSRRKKRKRTLIEGDSQSSATQTREQSVEEGELDSGKRGTRSSNRIRNASGSAPQPDRNDRREDRNSQRETRRRRSRSPPRQKTPPIKDVSDIFFVDIQPAPLPPTAIFQPTSATSPDTPMHTLLLPAHVSVFGAEPVEILSPSNADSDEEDYIEYLDFDDRKDVHRYFEDLVEESTKKSSRTVCKKCGAEGEHKTAACPVLICLTCGARNEHGTRSCPISKTCFTCGMKGHINATCPNRRAARRGDVNRYDDCDRCGSELHKTNECPTLWRLYEYLTEEARDQTIRNRKDKQNLKIGQGGEGYIADDHWCYNCGACGHWGDDCQDIPHQADLPNESSAFSIFNTLSGPFYDATAEPKPSTSRRRGPRDWEQGNGLPQDWGYNAPENVGKQGRRKNIAKMEQRVQEQAAEDDPDDWFGNSRNARNRGAPPSNGNRIPTAPKKMSFGKSLQDSGRQFQPPSSAPSLLDRLGDSYRGDSRSRYHDRSSDSRSRRPSYRDHYSPPSSRRADGYRPERDRDRYRRRDDTGPRYKGGYSR